MILSHYERPQSPWVWIQYGASARKKRFLKTSIRKDDPDKRRKIAIELNRIAAQVLPDASGDDKAQGADWFWVTPWLRTRYAARARTLQVYLAHWRKLLAYLAESEIECPGMLTREAVFGYVPWRTSIVKEKSGRLTKVNTAIGELKLLGMVMDEAVARHLAVENPARKLHIEREDSAEKPEITDAELPVILRALDDEPDWMLKSFLIGLHTGLRFSTTRLRRSQIRWNDDTILIERPKGGRKRGFSIPIYETIRPLLVAWRETGEEYLWTAPKGTLVGIAWWKFFRRTGMPHLCFHCTRVTFITRGCRRNIPESVMMKMVNHASKEINRIYQRWTPTDVRHYAAQLQAP